MPTPHPKGMGRGIYHPAHGSEVVPPKGHLPRGLPLIARDHQVPKSQPIFSSTSVTEGLLIVSSPCRPSETPQRPLAATRSQSDLAQVRNQPVDASRPRVHPGQLAWKRGCCGALMQTWPLKLEGTTSPQSVQRVGLWDPMVSHTHTCTHRHTLEQSRENQTVPKPCHFSPSSCP